MTTRLLLCSLILSALTALLPLPSLAAEPIGRLFLTPQERHALDELRSHTTSVASDTGNLTKPVNTAEHITVNGIVQRSSGKTSIWLNQLPQAGENGQGIVVIPSMTRPNTVSLRLPSGKRVNVKAGQTFDTAKGIVREGYENTADPLFQQAVQ
jgi:hypothetical protein